MAKLTLASLAEVTRTLVENANLDHQDKAALLKQLDGKEEKEDKDD